MGGEINRGGGPSVPINAHQCLIFDGWRHRRACHRLRRLPSFAYAFPNKEAAYCRTCSTSLPDDYFRILHLSSNLNHL